MPSAPRSIVILAATFAALLPIPPARAGDEPLTLEDAVTLHEVSEMEWSPDGNRLAFVVDGSDLEADEDVSVLWLADISGEAPRAAPRDGAPAYRFSPRWSPDGKQLAFLATDDEGTTQVWVERIDGIREPRALTAFFHGAQDFLWEPSGAALVVLAFPDPEPDAGIDEDDLDGAWAWRESDPDEAAILLRVPAAGGEPRPLLADMGRAIHDLAVDGARGALWFTTGDAGSHQADYGRCDLFELPAAGGAPRRRTEDPALEEFPLVLPDGRVAFLASAAAPAGGRTRTTTTLPRVLDPATGTVRTLGAGGEHDFSPPAERPSMAVSADGKALLAVALRGTRREVVSVDLESGGVRPLGGPWTSVEALAVAPRTGRVAVAGGDGTRLTEVWLAPSADRLAEAKPVTRLHARLDGRARPRVETIAWDAPGGLRVEGVLASPAGAAADARLPLVVSLHGGPWDADTASLAGVAAWWAPAATFAAAGRRTLFVNYRGSTGRGEAFLRALEGAPVTGPVADTLAGIDHLVGRGLADPERVFLTGYSYGGAVANGLLVSGRKFAAAVVGAGISNDVSFHGTSDGFVSSDSRYGAAPWEAPDLYVRESPVFHAAKCRTPTLFIHGTDDERVPPGQSMEMYRALRRVGVEADVLHMGGEGHAFATPSARLEYARAMLAWFDAHDPGRR